MTQQEALKLAMEALEDISSHYMSLPKKGCMALAAIEEALAEQETVLPGGGHVPAVPVAVYGYCPECGGAGVMRERRPNGDDKCTNGHKYPSSKALAEQPAQQQEPVAKVVSTAPERIWLDLGFDPEVEDEISFDDLFEATWSHDNATGNGIEYVRADLAPESKPWVGLTDEDLETMAEKYVTNCYFDTLKYARAIEAAHGIKENK